MSIAANEFDWPEQLLREHADALRWAMPREFGGDELDPLDLHLRYEQVARQSLSLALILREAFQALVLTRMVIRQEQTYKGATWVTYVNGPDGLAALDRGDVADVVARRLPD